MLRAGRIELRKRCFGKNLKAHQRAKAIIERAHQLSTLEFDLDSLENYLHLIYNSIENGNTRQTLEFFDMFLSCQNLMQYHMEMIFQNPPDSNKIQQLPSQYVRETEEQTERS